MRICHNRGPRLGTCAQAWALLAVVWLVMPAFPVHAAYHRYKDDAGTIHIVEDRGEIPEKYKSRAITIETKPPPKGTNLPSTPSEAHVAQPRVEVYTAPWCGSCRKLESCLKEERIRYVRYDIDKSQIARKRYQKLCTTGVPVTKIGTHLIRGYDPEQVMRRLGRDGPSVKSAIGGLSPSSWSIPRTLLAAFGIFMGLRFLRRVF